jgi:hypothetical protein
LMFAAPESTVPSAPIESSRRDKRRLTDTEKDLIV